MIDIDNELAAGDQKKTIVKKLLLIFFAVMLLLTFFSNTITNYTLPRVKVEYPTSGSLVKEILAQGEVLPKDSQCEYTSLNTAVKTVNVEAGDAVAKGQIVMTLDNVVAMTQYQEELVNLNKLKLVLDKLEQEAPANDNQTLKRKLADSQQKYEAAKRSYDRAKLLFDAGAESKVNLESAEDQMKTLEREYQQAREDYTQGIKSSRREIQDALYDITSQQLKVNNLKRELDTKYTLRAQCDGLVKEINFSPGTLTNNAQPLFVITNTAKGFEFKTTVDSDAANYLTKGDEVKISLKSSNRGLNGLIDRLVSSGEGKTNVFIDIDCSDLTGGEAGEAFISKNIGFYDCLVSNSALGQDSSGSFVWTLAERKGAFGNQLYLRKTSVTLDKSDNSKTAVRSGLDNEQKIVVSVEGNRQLTDGCRVMLPD